jgi:hypothetical protein
MPRRPSTQVLVTLVLDLLAGHKECESWFEKTVMRILVMRVINTAREQERIRAFAEEPGLVMSTYACLKRS